MARHLLNAFLYFSEDLMKQIASSAIHSVSYEVVTSKGDPFKARIEWKTFLDEVLVVAVPGEKPSATDSGNLFARHARDRFRIKDERFLSAEQALKYLISNGPAPIIFVDDFVGSGNQFITMWRRLQIVGAAFQSFETFSLKNPDWQPFYCPAIATTKGIEAIVGICARVRLMAGNELSPQYSAIDPDSLLWPDDLRPRAFDFIKTASARAQIPDAPGETNDWRGYLDQGLAVSFSHGTPDATLPIFTWNLNGWVPLIQK